MITLLDRAKIFNDRTALVSNGNSYTYAQLLETSNSVAANLINGKTDLNEARITFLVPPSFEYTAIQWGIWAAGCTTPLTFHSICFRRHTCSYSNRT